MFQWKRNETSPNRLLWCATCARCMHLSHKMTLSGARFSQFTGTITFMNLGMLPPKSSINRLSRLLSVALILCFLISPFTVFAEEELPTVIPDVATTTTTTEVTSFATLATTTEVTESTKVANTTNNTELISTPNTGFWVYHFTTNANPPLVLAVVPLDQQGGFVFTVMPHEGEVATDTLDLLDSALFSFVTALADGTATTSEMLVGFDGMTSTTTGTSTESGEGVGLSVFIGQTYDDSTTLSYLNARYYDGGNGKFISQDPVARDIGTILPTKESNSTCTSNSNANITSGNSSTCGSGNNGTKPGYLLNVNGGATPYSQTTLLADPQMLNSYSYSRNNPINFSDPSGLWAIAITGSIGAEIGFGAGVGGTFGGGWAFASGKGSGPEYGAVWNSGYIIGGDGASGRMGWQTPGAEKSNKGTGVLGGYAGMGIGIAFSRSANTIEQIAPNGVSMQTNYNAPAFKLNNKNFNLPGVTKVEGSTPTFNIGLGAIGSISTYPVSTISRKLNK